MELSREEKGRRHQPSFFLLRPGKWGEVGRCLLNLFVWKWLIFTNSSCKPELCEKQRLSSSKGATLFCCVALILRLIPKVLLGSVSDPANNDLLNNKDYCLQLEMAIPCSQLNPVILLLHQLLACSAMDSWTKQEYKALLFCSVCVTAMKIAHERTIKGE